MKRTADELQDSITERTARLRRDLGSPFDEDPRLQSYATALDAADAAAAAAQRRPRPAFLRGRTNGDRVLREQPRFLALFLDVSAPPTDEDILF